MYKGKNVSAADKIECSQEQKAYNELNKRNDKENGYTIWNVLNLNKYVNTMKGSYFCNIANENLVALLGVHSGFKNFTLSENNQAT